MSDDVKAGGGTSILLFGGGLVVGLALGWAAFSPTTPASPASPTPAVAASADATPTPDPGGLVIQGGKSNRLTELVSGIPAASGTPIQEVRSSFTPDETVLLQGKWSEGRGTANVHWAWVSPTGAKVYESDLGIQADWRNTWVTYRGPKPMPAGDWKVVATEDGAPLATLAFRVVRDPSEVPVRQQAAAFEAARITDADATRLSLALREVLDGGTADRVLEALPPGLADRQVLLAVSIYAGQQARLVRVGQGATLGDSVRDVVAAMSALGVPADDATLEVSIVHSSIEIPNRAGHVDARNDANIGFTLTAKGKSATLLPPHIARTGAGDGTSILRQLATDAGLPETAWQAADAKLSSFRTQDFVLVPGSVQAEPLVHARTVFLPDQLDHDALAEAVDRAAAWYLANQKEDGRYMYTFFPGKDLEPADDWCLRVLNAVFVMAEIAVARPDRPELRASVERAVDAFRGSIVEEGDKAYVNWTLPRADHALGSTAFLLATLATLDDPKDRALMGKLARAIMAEQEPSGRLSTDFVTPPDQDRAVDQQFYPGEALLSLVRYHAVTKDKAALATLDKAFPFYTEFWRNEKYAPFVPWQVRAYAERFQVGGKPEMKDFAFTMMDWMLDTYPPVDQEAGGWSYAGSLSRSSASTGVYAEGIEAAWDLARKVGDTAREQRYGAALVGASRYAVQLQYREHDVYAYARPHKVLGGLPTNPALNEMRLDFTYHAVSALHAAHRHTTPAQWEALHALAFP